MLHRVRVFLLLCMLSSCMNRVRVADVSTSGIELQMCSKTPAELIQKWMLSYEEGRDGGDTLVFRPETFAFPPSRGRRGIEFKKDGHFIQYDIGKSDMIEPHEGKWIYGAKTSTLDISFKKIEADPLPVSKDEIPPYVMQILKLDKQILKVRIAKTN